MSGTEQYRLNRASRSGRLSSLPDPPPAARLVNLHKAFGEHQVLKGVSIEIPAHRCTFVVGPSGAGKSVMVRHLVGLLKPDSGEVFYKDMRVDTAPEDQLYELRRRCVYVFQHPTLFDSMSVLMNVSLVIRYHTQLLPAQADALALEQLTRLGLDSRAASRPNELSGSEQKAVSLARALALKPETLILDEPTTGLDPYAALELDNYTSRLLKTGLTLIIISHDLRSVRRLAHDVVFLLDGNVRFHGPVSDFFSSSEPAIRQFIEGGVEGEI